MKKLCLLVYAVTWVCVAPVWAETLESGDYFITQSWSQEENYERLYRVQVPESLDKEAWPTLVVLHGNGGDALGAMRGFLRRNPKLATRFILVFAEGYAKSWNIVSERSKADDRGFIEAIVSELAAYDNIVETGFSILGNSNGAALVNQLAIECALPNIRSYISIVSPLNTFQHDGETFRAKGVDNNYGSMVKPMQGKRLLNISGVEDRLIPYSGGASSVIPAKGGKLAFVPAEESIFLWAQAMGYRRERLAAPTRSEGPLEVFSYLDGDVIHYKVNGVGHGAGGAVDESILLEFLSE